MITIVIGLATTATLALVLAAYNTPPKKRYIAVSALQDFINGDGKS